MIPLGKTQAHPSEPTGSGTAARKRPFDSVDAEAQWWRFSVALCTASQCVAICEGSIRILHHLHLPKRESFQISSLVKDPVTLMARFRLLLPEAMRPCLCCGRVGYVDVNYVKYVTRATTWKFHEWSREKCYIPYIHIIHIIYHLWFTILRLEIRAFSIFQHLSAHPIGP